jgi:16S rRNA processing protein RimM
MNAPADKLMPVAKVIKSFGNEGEIVVRFASSFRDDINEKKPVFIKYDGLPVPFFISCMTTKGNNQAIIKLKGIDSSSLSEEITGQTIFTNYMEVQVDDSDFSLLVGFSVLDQDGRILGKISSFHDYPGNPCFGITPSGTKQSEFLVPVHEDFILDSNFDKKEIRLILPKGLTDL